MAGPEVQTESGAGPALGADGSGALIRADRRMPGLDGLRGVAVLLVLAHHLMASTGPISNAIAGSGWIGVDLFFVLSGFLITGILCDSREGKHYFRNFYARRVLRIFPLFYGMLALVFFGLPLLHRIGIIHMDKIPGTVGPTLLSDWEHLSSYQIWFWTYCGNISSSLGMQPYVLNHFWSLAVEEHFYLVWPAIVFVCSRRQLKWVCWGLILLVPVLRGILVAKGDPWIVYIMTPCRVDSLAVGALLAILGREMRNGTGGMELLAKPAKWVLGAGAAYIAWELIAKGAVNHEGVFERVIGLSVLAIFFAALLVVTLNARPGKWWSRVICSYPLLKLGKYSYGIYVLHRFVLMPTKLFAGKFMGEYGHNLWILAGINFVLTLGAAWLSWHLYEKHFLKLKRWFPYG